MGEVLDVNDLGHDALKERCEASPYDVAAIAVGEGTHVAVGVVDPVQMDVAIHRVT